MPLPDYGQIQNQSRIQAEQDIAPVVSSLEAQRQPLIDRYQSIIEGIGSREAKDISTTNTNTSREYGRRGIPLSSGVFENTLQERVSPIRQQYAGLSKDAGFAREGDLRDLSTRIASTRAGAYSDASSRGQSLYNTQLGQYNADRGYERGVLESDRAFNQSRSTASASAARDAEFKRLMESILGGNRTTTATGGGNDGFIADPPESNVRRIGKNGELITPKVVGEPYKYTPTPITAKPSAGNLASSYIDSSQFGNMNTNLSSSSLRLTNPLDNLLRLRF